MPRTYRIDVERDIVQRKTLYIKANNKGQAVAIALSEANTNPGAEWNEVVEERSPAVLARKR